MNNGAAPVSMITKKRKVGGHVILEDKCPFVTKNFCNKKPIFGEKRSLSLKFDGHRNSCQNSDEKLQKM